MAGFTDTPVINNVQGIYKVSAITPSDTGDNKFDAIFLDTSGIVKFKDAAGSDWITFNNLQLGVWHPMNVTAIHTDSTATLYGGRKN